MSTLHILPGKRGKTANRFRKRDAPRADAFLDGALAALGFAENDKAPGGTRKRKATITRRNIISKRRP
jgi:hypothetical protein